MKQQLQLFAAGNPTLPLAIASAILANGCVGVLKYLVGIGMKQHLQRSQLESNLRHRKNPLTRSGYRFLTESGSFRIRERKVGFEYEITWATTRVRDGASQ